jgi:hypothetical protein
MFRAGGEMPPASRRLSRFAVPDQGTSDGQAWEADPWIIDERCLIINVEGDGLLVFTACSPAGLITKILPPVLPKIRSMLSWAASRTNQPLISFNIAFM